MEIPKLPTDNLYKFMALSGLVILILSAIPYYRKYEFDIELIRLEAEAENLRLKIRENAAYTTTEFEFKCKEILRRITMNNYLKGVAYVCSFVGSFLTTLGFYLWYVKLQRYQDRIIKKEAAQIDALEKQGGE